MMTRGSARTGRTQSSNVQPSAQIPFVSQQHQPVPATPSAIPGSAALAGGGGGSGCGAAAPVSGAEAYAPVGLETGEVAVMFGQYGGIHDGNHDGEIPAVPESSEPEDVYQFGLMVLTLFVGKRGE
jgi:hypothetical protein